MLQTSLWRKKTLPGLEVLAAEVTHDNAKEIAAWCNGVNVREYDAFDASKQIAGVNVPTEQGMVRASEGAYVFQLIEGMFLVEGPERFQAIWEPAVDMTASA